MFYNKKYGIGKTLAQLLREMGHKTSSPIRRKSGRKLKELAKIKFEFDYNKNP